MERQERSGLLKGVVRHPFFQGYVVAGLAAVSATTFTNGIEVVKTRMQLQGELLLIAERPYKGIANCFATIFRQEGIAGFYKGIYPAWTAQSILYGGRLGTYPITKKLMGSENPSVNFWFLRNVLAGAFAGGISAAMASPIDLIKVRMQAQSPTVYLGHSYHYKSATQAFLHIYKNEGVKGVCRGAWTSAQRTAIGSAVQLSSYDQCKLFVLSSGLFQDNIYAYFASSLVAGLLVTTAMNPFDVARTRMYNQKVGAKGEGLYYKGMMDCVIKTVRSEGFFALYKGWGAHYLRLGPHTCLVFVFWEQLKKLFNLKS
eukprot:TRINITY_DN1625_c0_g1_i1.p1 TRINITY_DN1625_c0_g1~~TRINITY_DN1625_c0_g1_i1.p1  ORF type:complete len:315 (-),score=32.27 TRINITY_DN1625_c0_g1_i1:65-1009(-)